MVQLLVALKINLLLRQRTSLKSFYNNSGKGKGKGRERDDILEMTSILEDIRLSFEGP